MLRKRRLSNGLTLSIWEETRRIADETVSVALCAGAKIDVKADYFDNDDQYRLLIGTLGSVVSYSYRKERTFVPLGEEDSVVQAFLKNFEETTLPYIARDSFPSRFILARFRDVLSPSPTRWPN